MSDLKESRVIRHVSFLHKGERTIVESDERGTFRVPVTSVIEGRTKTVYKNLSASELIAHPSVINSDPVITLKTGDKVRVFTGGDSSYLPAMSQGIIERHDKVEMLRRKFEKKKRVLKEKQEKEKRGSKKTPIITPFSHYVRNPSDTDEHDNSFFWDDDDDGIY
jgi:hypothetical protein